MRQRWYVQLTIEDPAREVFDSATALLGPREEIEVHVATQPMEADPRCTFEGHVDGATDALDAAARMLAAVGSPSRDRVLNVRARTGTELDHEHLEDELLGVTELAELLKITPQRVSALSRRQGKFPSPWAVLRSGPVWRRAEIDMFVKAWPRKRGRPAARVEYSARVRSDHEVSVAGLANTKTFKERPTLERIRTWLEGVLDRDDFDLRVDYDYVGLAPTAH